MNGLRVLFQEKAARRELLVAIPSLVLVILDQNIYFVLIFCLSFLLFAFEAINTAIEHLCDLYTKSYEPRIKSIKDVAATAIFLVLMSQISLFVLWWFNRS